MHVGKNFSEPRWRPEPPKVEPSAAAFGKYEKKRIELIRSARVTSQSAESAVPALQLHRLIKPMQQVHSELDALGGGLDIWPRRPKFAKPHFLPLQTARLESDVKPRLMVEIEQYLASEIDKRGIDASKFSEERFQVPPCLACWHAETSLFRMSRLVQVHREVFQFFISQFQVWRPLLTCILREYDECLELYRQQAKDVVQAKTRIQAPIDFP